MVIELNGEQRSITNLLHPFWNHIGFFSILILIDLFQKTLFLSGYYYFIFIFMHWAKGMQFGDKK